MGKTTDSIKFVIYDISSDSPVTPSDPLPKLPEGYFDSDLIIIIGSAPFWRYAMAIDKIAWECDFIETGKHNFYIAVRDPVFGDIIVFSTTLERFEIGDIVNVNNE